MLAAVLALAGWWALGAVDLAATGSALAAADPRLLAAAVALYALGQTFSGVMWATCQEAGGVRALPLGPALGMHWIARGACELLPAGLGEAVRVGLVRRHPAGARAGAWRISGALVSYKAIDAVVTIGLVVAFAVIIPMPGAPSGLRWGAVAALVVLVAVVVAARAGAGRHILRAVPSPARPHLARLAAGARGIGEPGAAATASALGLAAAGCRVLSLGALLMALGAPVQAAALAFCVVVLVGVVPGAPGGAGSRELVLVPALVAAHAVPVATALAFSVAVQGVALATSLALGAAALAWPSARGEAPPDPAGALTGDHPPARPSAAVSLS